MPQRIRLQVPTQRAGPASTRAGASHEPAYAARAPGAPGAQRPGRGQERCLNPSRIFILRPVATSLLMVAVILAGAIAFRQLPQSALPQVDYPTIQVSTLYPGASP